MGIDYSTKIGFKCFIGGSGKDPEINYHILSYGWGAAETLSLRKDTKTLSFTYAPQEEKIQSLNIQDGGEKYEILYDRTHNLYISRPDLPHDEVEKLLQFALKKFADIKEKYGLEEKVRQYNIVAKAKSILDSF